MLFHTLTLVDPEMFENVGKEDILFPHVSHINYIECVGSLQYQYLPVCRYAYLEAGMYVHLLCMFIVWPNLISSAFLSLANPPPTFFPPVP